MAVLFLSAYVGLKLNRYKYLKYLSPVFLTMAFTIILSNFRIIPNDAPVYDFVWQYFIPLSIPLVLMRADFKTIYEKGGSTLTAFIFGAIGTILGTITVFSLFDLPGEMGKLVSMFCATYIGGSVNFVSVSKALNLQNNDLFLAGTAADNITMALYFTTLGVMSSSTYMLARFPVSVDVSKPIPTKLSPTDKLDVTRTLMAVFISLGIVAVSDFLSQSIEAGFGIKVSSLLFVTAGSIVFANLFRDLALKLNSAEIIGYAFLQVFFGVIGANADVVLAVTQAPQIFLMTVTLLSIQLLVLFTLGRLAGLDLRSLIIAANANVGGPATAAAMATTFGWREQVIPGILTGVLGYAVATYIGVSIADIYKVVL